MRNSVRNVRPVAQELKRRGHQVVFEPSEFGGYQAIWYDAEKDTYIGATESRKDGIALGY